MGHNCVKTHGAFNSNPHHLFCILSITVQHHQNNVPRKHEQTGWNRKALACVRNLQAAEIQASAAWGRNVNGGKPMVVSIALLRNKHGLGCVSGGFGARVVQIESRFATLQARLDLVASVGKLKAPIQVLRKPCQRNRRRRITKKEVTCSSREPSSVTSGDLSRSTGSCKPKLLVTVLAALNMNKHMLPQRPLLKSCGGLSRGKNVNKRDNKKHQQNRS